MQIQRAERRHGMTDRLSPAPGELTYTNTQVIGNSFSLPSWRYDPAIMPTGMKAFAAATGHLYESLIVIVSDVIHAQHDIRRRPATLA